MEPGSEGTTGRRAIEPTRQAVGIGLRPRHHALHDRHLRLNHGVLFKLGRGLDVYKPAAGLAIHRPTIRRVRASEIDVFVIPGHTLATQPETANT